MEGTFALLLHLFLWLSRPERMVWSYYNNSIKIEESRYFNENWIQGMLLYKSAV